jgi:patatin-like phospholipase/acyl hydrolase
MWRRVVELYCGGRRLGDLQKHVIITSFKLAAAAPHARVGEATGPRQGGEARVARARWQPAVFSNIPQTVSGTEAPDTEMPVIQAALRTSAAPTLFPLHEGYTDGGPSARSLVCVEKVGRGRGDVSGACAGAVFANNPSLVGVTKVKSHFPTLKSADVRVLSLGTGDFPTSIDLQGDENASWGIRQWAPHLLDM